MFNIKMFEKVLFICLLNLLSFNFISAQNKKEFSIIWSTMNKDMMSDKSKLILVDLYTNWCGWCKTMDENTFTNAGLVQYVKENYNSYKFDAELEDNITFNEKVFRYDSLMHTHKLAIYLTDGQLAYPTTLIIDPETKSVYPFPGYHSAKDMEFILKYFKETKVSSASSTTYQNFKNSFKSTW